MVIHVSNFNDAEQVKAAQRQGAIVIPIAATWGDEWAASHDFVGWLLPTLIKPMTVDPRDWDLVLNPDASAFQVSRALPRVIKGALRGQLPGYFLDTQPGRW